MDKMKILFINRSDIEGGASRGAVRLLAGIGNQGVDARLYVQQKSGNNPFITGPPAAFGRTTGFARRMFESILFGLSFRKMLGLFSPAFLPDRLLKQISAFNPDVIHLHWVARMMRLENLCRIKTPIVWTLHDSWPFTGGCFLPGDCDRYREMCGKCPVLNSSQEKDLSRSVWRRKSKAWQGLNLTLIAPSSWMARRAKASSLFHDIRVEVIPNGLDVKHFKPTDKKSARVHLSLPHDKKLLLFGAKEATKDKNKGFHLLLQSLQKIAESKWRDEIELVVFGASQPSPPLNIGIKTHFTGWLDNDSTLALLYGAADVFILPSLQENLPYAVMEAMACGTPCVAFAQGGLSDLIEHKLNGYLARPFEPDDLTQGIAWLLEDNERHKELSAGSRQKVVEEFAIEKVTERHMNLYRELLDRK